MDLTHLIEHSDNFLEFKENGLYEARCTGFIIRNVGNTTVRLNKGWILYPNQEYSMQSLVIHAIVNKDYAIEFMPMPTPYPDNVTPVNHVLIAEEHYALMEYSNYSPIK